MGRREVAGVLTAAAANLQRDVDDKGRLLRLLGEVK